MSSHIWSRHMAIHLCGSFQVYFSQHLLHILSLFSCMGPDMCLRMGSLVKYIVSLWKGKWLFYLVDPRQISCHIWSRHLAFHLCGSFHVYLECQWLTFMYLHFTTCFKCCVTFGAIKWTISFVGSVMFLQLFTFCLGPFMFFSRSCMCRFMCLQMGFLAKYHVTHWNGFRAIATWVEVKTERAALFEIIRALKWAPTWPM